MHVSVSIFLKRFSICDSVTTVLSSFLLSQMILFLECILTFSTFLLCCLKCQYAISKVSQTIFCEGQRLMKRVLMYVSYVTLSIHFSLMLYSECLYLKHAIFPILNLLHPATSKLSTTVVIPSIYVWVHLTLYKTSNSVGWNKNKKLIHTCPDKQILMPKSFLLLSFLMVYFSNTFSLLVARWQLKTMNSYLQSFNP